MTKEEWLEQAANYKLTIDDIKNLLLKTCINTHGNLDLSWLDFSDFDGNVNISNMKVKWNLRQDDQIVGGFLYQDHQTVGKDLYQNNQIVKDDLLQHSQSVGKDLCQSFQKVQRDLYQSDQNVKRFLLND